ncbi:MAG: type II toxin-antitoxin system VapC family toxin [Chlamydiales bacterium]
MTYLLDTCILSKLRRMSKYPDPKLRAWIEQHPASLYYISVFSIAEIQAGIAQIANTPSDRKKYKSDLEDWLFNDLVPDFEGRIIDFDLKTAHRWGSLVGEFKQKGINFPIIDSIIAATALHHELIMVTENVADFEKIGLTIVNPWN